MSDTLNARRDFLRKYPNSNEQGMPKFIDTLLYRSGRCDAASLNRSGSMIGMPISRNGNNGNLTKPTKPNHCAALENHE